MKKFLSLILICFLVQALTAQNSALAADEDTSPGDDWSDISKMQGAWDNQKIITDDQFEKVIEQRTAKSKQKQEKKFKKKYGEALVPNNSSETSTLKSIRQVAQEYPTLLVPKTLLYDEVVIPPGFYLVIAAKNKNNEIFINFYQGNSLIGKIPAMETDDDFGAETINYAKIIYAENDSRAKVVYGCIDYNLVANTGTK